MPKHRAETAETRRIERLLKERFPNHPPEFPPKAYRYNPGSIRVRIVSNRFKGKSFWERQDMVQPIIDTLPEKAQSDILILLLLTPGEVRRSAANEEFENPTPSRL